MAETAVSFVVDKLGNLLVQELTLLHGVNDQVKQLQRELQRIQCFLRDADTKRKTNEGVRHWVKEIRDVAHEAEDVIDTFIIDADRHRRRHGVCGFLKRYLLTTTSVVGHHKASIQITAIMNKISEISVSRITYDIKKLDENCGGVERPVVARRSIVPDVEDSDVVAFDGHMSALVKQLLGHSENRSVMSIVGIGGLGKTTLAQKVYNSVEVKSKFGIRIWITVSQDYKSVELLNEILEQVRKDDKKEKLEERKVTEKLRDSLKEKRYLIVMDDVWSRDVWEQMKSAFPDEKNGSRVLITTRDSNVAKYADPTTPYELCLLTDAESLELLLKKAFANQDVQANCTEDLRSIGRQLVKRCGHLPLALVVVGGLLSIREKEYSVWQRVLETMDWPKEGKECMAILALSYEDLPHYLKSCFLYLAAFPEDTVIRANRLIRLWIAEGFIPRQGRGTMEETAEDCLEELAQRCMVQVVRRTFNGRSIKSCRVHDLLREFAVSEAKEDGFLVIYNNSNQDAASLPGPGRRAAFHNLNGFQGLNIPPNLRSLLAFNMEQPNFSDYVSQLKLLRVIDLRGAVGIKSLPEEIKSMIHLRYLGLSDSTMLEVIPSSIGHLQNLETLDVTDTHSLRKLPPTLWNIKKLRHVLVTEFGVEGPPPSADLPNLQTLGWVEVPESWEGGLPNITSVRKLGLRFGFQDRGKILSRLLEKLHHLLSLTVLIDHPEEEEEEEASNCINDVIPCWASNCLNDALPCCASNCKNDAEEEEEAKMNVEAVSVTIPSGIDTRAFKCHDRIQKMELFGRWYSTTVGSHEFPPHLVKLTLKGSRLEHDPMPTLEKLQNLRVLKLMFDAYMGKKMICSAGGFPQLQTLELVHLDQLEEWCLEADAMPKTTRVRILYCTALKVVPEFQRLPNLQELELNYQPQEFMDRIRVNGGEDHYKIQNMQSVTIY